MSAPASHFYCVRHDKWVVSAMHEDASGSPGLAGNATEFGITPTGWNHPDFALVPQFIHMPSCVPTAPADPHDR